jgi:hypothetical protein
MYARRMGKPTICSSCFFGVVTRSNTVVAMILVSIHTCSCSQFHVAQSRASSLPEHRERQTTRTFESFRPCELMKQCLIPEVAFSRPVLSCLAHPGWNSLADAPPYSQGNPERDKTEESKRIRDSSVSGPPCHSSDIVIFHSASEQGILAS